MCEYCEKGRPLTPEAYRERTCRDDGVGVFRCTACGAFTERGAVMDCCGAIPIRYCPNCGAKVAGGPILEERP